LFSSCSTLGALVTKAVVLSSFSTRGKKKSPNGKAVLNDWGCGVGPNAGAVPFEGTFRYASVEVLAEAIQQADRVPKAQDDLHALLRSVLAIAFDLRATLAKLGHGDFLAASKFWVDWRSEHPVYEAFFSAADKLDYAVLRGLI
jgi:hypothetical protein